MAMTAHTTDEERLERVQRLSDQIAELEERHRKATAQLNEEIFYAFPENRGETGKPPHGWIKKLIERSQRSRQHINDVRAGKYRTEERREAGE